MEKEIVEEIDLFDPLDSLESWVLESKFFVTLKDKLAALPARPGVYLMKNALGDVIYVGKAVVLKNRVRSYFQKLGKDVSNKVRRMVHEVADIEWIVTDTELEALILESNLIKKYRPHYNVRLKDDKSYPYICITLNERFPRPIFLRKIKFEGKDGNRYFGPYTDSMAVRETLRLIRRVFGVPCGYKDPSQSKGRACLYYHIGQCLGPCNNSISEEEYAQVIRDVILFLEGRQEKLLKELQHQMEAASEKLLFEKAARLRDQIQAVQRIIERQKIISTAMVDQDVVAIVTDNGNAVAQMCFIRNGKLIGQEHFMLEGTSGDDLSEGVQEFVKQYYQAAAYVPKEILLQCEIDELEIIESWLRQKRGTKVEISHPVRGEKRQLVEMAETNAEAILDQLRKKVEADEAYITIELGELQQALDLPKLPRRIECYDISNIMGTEAVGSLVVFENGRPKKSDYRRFKIKYTPERPDDYAMMREVLARRLTGQLRQSEKFAELPDLLMVDGGKGQLGIAVEVLDALGEDVPVIGLAKEYEEVFKPGESDPRLLPRNSKGLHVLQRIRDEAHRFAVEYHRKLRSKRMTRSILAEIPGIGKKRRSALLKHFGSLKRIREATIEELEQAPTMTRPAAEAVFSYLQMETSGKN
ncbi:MAG TPA: excinuclease ABC subunit UvrC [Armatimonadota bacterium]|nr:excinuclease ABC subunit UvrC [Armatimonadota bacterium]